MLFVSNQKWLISCTSGPGKWSPNFGSITSNEQWMLRRDLKTDHNINSRSRDLES